MSAADSIADGTAEPKSPNRRIGPRVTIGPGNSDSSLRQQVALTSDSNSDSDSSPRTPVTPDSDASDRGIKTPITPGTPSAYIRLMFDPPDLTEPDDFADVTLVAEDKKLYTCRGILASASPVWRRMFMSDFKEKSAKEIPLPNKKFEDIMELLLCISPAIQKPITGDNVSQVLPLADEYQMLKLKQDCETWMMYQLESIPSQEEAMKHLAMAQKYSLERLLDRAVDLVSDLAVGDLENHPDYKDIERETMVRILRQRVSTLERNNAKLTQSTESWRKKAEELEDCLKKMSREKFTIKRTLDEVSDAWDSKNCDARCIDPVHIYGPRHFHCEKCTRQVHTYIQGKVWFLLNKGSTWSGITWPQ